MAVRAIRNKDGFTLVEVLVTLVILACGLLGSLIGIMTSIDHVLMNEMRNEAIKIAQEQCEEARNMAYASIQTIPATQTVQRQVRNSLRSFTVNTATTPLTGYSPNGTTKVSTTVQWTFKNKTSSFLLETIVRQTR